MIFFPPLMQYHAQRQSVFQYITVENKILLHLTNLSSHFKPFDPVMFGKVVIVPC